MEIINNLRKEIEDIIPNLNDEQQKYLKCLIIDNLDDLNGDINRLDLELLDSIQDEFNLFKNEMDEIKNNIDVNDLNNFHSKYNYLLERLPDSVIKQMKIRIDKTKIKGIQLNIKDCNDEMIDFINNEIEKYEGKKNLKRNVYQIDLLNKNIDELIIEIDNYKKNEEFFKWLILKLNKKIRILKKQLN